MAKKKRKIVLIVLLVLILVASLGFGAYYLVTKVFNDKISYALIMQEYDDAYEDDYLEKDETLSSINSFGINFEKTINSYKTVSKSVDVKIDIYSPYFLHLPISYKQIKEIKKINAEVSTYKSEFKISFDELKRRLNIYATITDESIKSREMLKVQKFYYLSFLPKYLDYINIKNRLSYYMQDILKEKDIITETTKTIIDMQNIIIDYSIKFIFPTITYLTYESENDNYDDLLLNLEKISLAKINTTLNNLYNIYHTDKSIIESYKRTLYKIKSIINIANNLFDNFTAEQKESFFKNPITKPATLPEITSSNYKIELLKSIVAHDGGSFISLLNSVEIENFFDGGEDD